jgi:hypothetical protein
MIAAYVLALPGIIILDEEGIKVQTQRFCLRFLGPKQELTDFGLCAICANDDASFHSSSICKMGFDPGAISSISYIHEGLLVPDSQAFTT